MASETSALRCSSLVYLLRLQMVPSYCVEVGGIEGQYGL